MKVKNPYVYFDQFRNVASNKQLKRFVSVRFAQVTIVQRELQTAIFLADSEVIYRELEANQHG